MPDPVPVMVEVSAEGAPGLKITLPPTLLTGELKVRVFVSALVDVRVQVARPEALVLEQVP